MSYPVLRAALERIAGQGLGRWSQEHQTMLGDTGEPWKHWAAIAGEALLASPPEFTSDDVDLLTRLLDMQQDFAADIGRAPTEKFTGLRAKVEALRPPEPALKHVYRAQDFNNPQAVCQKCSQRATGEPSACPGGPPPCTCQQPWSSHGNYEHAADCPAGDEPCIECGHDGRTYDGHVCEDEPCAPGCEACDEEDTPEPCGADDVGECVRGYGDDAKDFDACLIVEGSDSWAAPRCLQGTPGCHTPSHAVGAQTGRMSCAGPNLSTVEPWVPRVDGSAGVRR